MSPAGALTDVRALTFDVFGTVMDWRSSAEVARHYKPQPEAYLTTAALLGLRPEQCMMVAAHNGDLVSASRCGLRTAFVSRPTEHGPTQTTGFRAEHDFDVVARDFVDLADKLSV
jgi:2-haloacid dehalogenase